MMTQRVQGKTSFANIKDMSGQIQLFIQRDGLPEGVYLEFKKWDLGDIVGVGGSVYRTNSGELSVKVDKASMLDRLMEVAEESRIQGVRDTLGGFYEHPVLPIPIGTPRWPSAQASGLSPQVDSLLCPEGGYPLRSRRQKLDPSWSGRRTPTRR